MVDAQFFLDETARRPAEPKETSEMPAQLMTREVKTCSPEDQLVDTMGVMTLQRIPHLPVIQDGALHGIVSISDVVKQRLEGVKSEADRGESPQNRCARRATGPRLVSAMCVSNCSS